MIVVVYVDDLVLIGSNTDAIFILKSQLDDTFEMKNLGLIHLFLGVQVLPLLDGPFISQSKYVLDMLKHFKMNDYNVFATPFQEGVKLTEYCGYSKVDATLYHWLVGGLIYLTHSQPNISFDNSILVSYFMHDPREI